MYIPLRKENEKLAGLFESEERNACLHRPGGIYCMVQLILYEGPVRLLYNSTQLNSKNAIKSYNNLKLHKGVCLTTACENYVQNTGLEINKDLEYSLQRCISTVMSNKYDLFAKAYNISCDTQINNGYKIDRTDNIVAVIFIALILANVIGSCYDFIHRNKDKKKYNKGQELLLCFSIFRNYKWFSSKVIKHVKSRVFRDLYVVRTITACSLVYVDVLFMEQYTLKIRADEQKYGSVPYRMSPSGLIIVQIFFFVAGYLLTLLRQPKIFKISVISKILFIRWFRLAVPTALVMAFSATWLRHFSRSQWIHNTAEHCRLHYWAHLFYYNNHLPNNTLCSIQTWYMTAETQLLGLGLLIRFILSGRSTKSKGKILALLLLIGIVSPLLHTWYQDLDVSQRPEVYSVLYELSFLKLHVLPHNNLICFIMSMATSYVASYLFESKTEWPNWKIGRFLCWCVIPGIAVVVYWSGEGWWGAALSGAAAAAVGALCSLWVLGTVMKFNGLSALLKGRGWKTLSNLSYSVYLLHPTVILLVSEKRINLVYENNVSMNTIFIVVLLVTYALAWTFYLLVTAPLIQIIKLVALTSDLFK